MLQGSNQLSYMPNIHFSKLKQPNCHGNRDSRLPSFRAVSLPIQAKVYSCYSPWRTVIKFTTTRSWRHTPFRNNSPRISDSFFCSWRHTPFRNLWVSPTSCKIGSWRHTPFRNFAVYWLPVNERSWRHTPFRKVSASSRVCAVRSWRHTPFRKHSRADHSVKHV